MPNRLPATVAGRWMGTADLLSSHTLERLTGHPCACYVMLAWLQWVFTARPLTAGDAVPVTVTSSSPFVTFRGLRPSTLVRAGSMI